ncbi:MAG: hypothetical protein ABH846_04190 [Patescibacteria group bacterium]
MKIDRETATEDEKAAAQAYKDYQYAMDRFRSVSSISQPEKDSPIYKEVLTTKEKYYQLRARALGREWPEVESKEEIQEAA